jgi:fructose-specific phosphotransferase system component IIB
MLDREASWRSRSKVIVAKNKEVDSSKREDSKIMRINTRSAVVVI